MKYVIVQGDGMGDLLERPGSENTPLEAARTPNFDRIAGCGLFGLVRTIPPGLPPGSDVGHLSLFGYDPGQYYTGRSPLEAVAMGISLGPRDVAFRMNLVTTRGEGADLVMDDYSAGHIGSAASGQLVGAIGEALGNATFQFFAGVGYRHLLVWRGGRGEMETTPPHDITGLPLGPHLPRGPGAEELLRIMEASREILAAHPLAQTLAAEGTAASQAWLWGQGRALSLPPFFAMHGLRGAVISAVDLVRGVALAAGFAVVHVPGATGYLDTDYAAKGRYGLGALDGRDLIFIHIEAPDEAAHMGDREEKIRAIEAIDSQIVGPLLEGLAEVGPYKILIVSDHATPVTTRTHCYDPVPFALATGGQIAAASTPLEYGEGAARAAGVMIDPGHSLIGRLLAWPE